MTRKPHDGGLSRRWILAACDDSLERLGLDYIDIYYLHKDDPDTPIAETVGALGELMRAGKIRYFGVSNYRGWRIAEIVSRMRGAGRAAAGGLPALLQPAEPHAGSRDPARVRLLRHRRRAVFAGGARRADRQSTRPARRCPKARAARAATGAWRRPSCARSRSSSRRSCASTRRRPAASLLQFALAWLWANRIVSSVIAGPRTPEQWHDYVAALGTNWSDEDEALVDSLVAPGHPSTPGYNDPQYPFFGRILP